MYRQLVVPFPEADLSFLIGFDSLAAEWKTIGVHLGVPLGQLNVIQQDNRNNVSVSRDCLREMLSWCLMNREDVTAKKLAKAVHEVGNHKAEAKINDKFGM